MRCSVLVVGLLVVLGGCHAPKHNLAARFPEEFVAPPDEARFNNPPESGYRHPPAKKEFRPGPGMGGPGMGGGGGGMNGF